LTDPQPPVFADACLDGRRDAFFIGDGLSHTQG
jgi:hypothetical protein